MQAWTVDAARILTSGKAEELSPADVVTNQRIDLFLESDLVSFVVAPKGFGKTLLLILKRLQYHNGGHEGFLLIPGGGLLVDVPITGAGNLDLGKRTIAFFSDRRNWEGIWRACISLSIIQTMRRNGALPDTDPRLARVLAVPVRQSETEFPILGQLLSESTLDTPLDFLNWILTKLKPHQYRGLIQEQDYLDHVVKSFHTPIAIFIDNVDEYFEEHLEKRSADYNPSVRGVFDIKIWHLAQQGLMFAVRTLCRSNHHLDIFASIRKEAYEKIESTTLENMRGSCIDDLQFSKAKLKEIFERNIRRTSPSFLVNPALRDENPIRSLCDFDVIRHEHIDREESLFGYLYRHTLKRPRDVIRLGLRIVLLDKGDRTPERVKDVIDEEAQLIGRDYIQLCLPHTSFADESELMGFLQRIPHNILDYQTLRRICADFNGGCDQLVCSGCDRQHPFCELYRLGLIGIVKFHDLRKQYRQEFRAPGELGPLEKGILPRASQLQTDFYLIHPILNSLIGGDPRARISNDVVVGDREPWTAPALPESVRNRKLFLSYSGRDREYANKLARDLMERGIPVWLDKMELGIGDVVREKILEGIAECEYFGVLISKASLVSEWVKGELATASWREIEKKQITIIPILIEDVPELPQLIRDRHYADFYHEGYEVALEQLVERLIEGTPLF